jgi:long-chain fatty acid transport protein
VVVKITEAQRLAFTYKLPFNIDYDGNFNLSNIPQGVPAAAASDFNTQFKYPQSAAVGYGIRVTDTIRLEADVEWMEHSCNQSLDLDVGANNPLLNALSTNSIAQNWKNTWTFGLGGDWQFSQNWQLRAGYTYMPTPVPQQTLMPSAADEDQSVVSVGIGYRCSHHAVDVALAQGLFNGREVRNNQNPAYNGDYDFRSTLLGISYQYMF